MPYSVSVLVFVALLVVLAAADLQCSVNVTAGGTAHGATGLYESIRTTLLHFDSDRGDWIVNATAGRLEGGAAAFGALDPAAPVAVRRLLRHRRVLFAGDSTVRNTAIALIAATCNRQYTQCAQRASWSDGDGVANLRPSAGRASAGGAPPSSSTPAAILSALSCGDAARCHTRITATVIPIANLTSERLPRSKMERRYMWKHGILPPMVRVTLHELNATVDVVEAGCAGGGDGLWLVFRHMLRSHLYAENVSAAQHLLGDRRLSAEEISASAGKPSIPPLARYDAVVSSAGLHCTYKHYRAGMWYRHLKRGWPVVTALTPLVWLEVTHCLKDNTGHFFMYGRQQRLNYKKLASCPFIDSHVATMNRLFLDVPGVFVSPTRHVTKGLRSISDAARGPTLEERRNATCLFADYLHPALTCYAALNQGHLAVLRAAFERQDLRRRNGCLAGAPLAAADAAAREVDAKPAPAATGVGNVKAARDGKGASTARREVVDAASDEPVGDGDEPSEGRRHQPLRTHDMARLGNDVDGDGGPSLPMFVAAASAAGMALLPVTRYVRRTRAARRGL